MRHILSMSVFALTVLLHGSLRAQTTGREHWPELVLQIGHTSSISAAAFSPDGRQVVTASWDKIAILWDAASGQKLRAFQGHADPVASVVFTADGRRILTGARDDTEILWDLATGEKLRTFQWRAGGVSSLAFTRDGRLAVTGSADGTAILWDAANGQRLHTLRGHADRVNSVAFSPDGREVVTGSDDKTAILWDAAGGQKLRTFQGHTDHVSSVAFSPDGRQIVTGSDDKTAILWDAAGGQKLRTFQGHTDHVSSVAFSPDGRQALTGSEDKTAMLWDAANGKKLRTLQGHGGGVNSVGFSPDGHLVLTGSGDATAILWDAAGGQKLRAFQSETYNVSSVAFSPDGRQVLTGSFDKTAILWDAAEGRQPRALQGHTGPVTSAVFSADGRQVLTGSWDETAILWDAARGQKLRTFQGGHSHFVSSVAFSPDGQQVLTGSYDSTAVLWDAASGQKLRIFRGHARYGYVASVAFSPDGRHVLTGSWDNTAVLWDAAGGQKLRTFHIGNSLLEAGTLRVTSVAFSPDGRKIVTGFGNGTVVLWDATGGQKLRTFGGNPVTRDSFPRIPVGEAQSARASEGPSVSVESVAFSHDGRQLLTGYSDGTTALWDAAEGQKLRTFQGHSGEVTSVAFSPDGRQVLTGSSDGTTRLWDPATGKEIIRLIKLNQGRDWVVATPEGLFDGSEAGRQRVSYRVGGAMRPTPVDRFFQDFYRPGLLAEIWKGRRPMPEVELGGSLPPTVKIVAPQGGPVDSQEVTVEVAATDQGGGISKLAIHHNGARVLTRGEARQEGNALRRIFQVTLIEGENRIRVTAASLDGSWESEPAEIVLKYEKPLEKPALHLLAVGVNRYAKETMNLKFAASDADAFAQLFQDRGPALYGEGQVHVRKLTDRQATKEGIREALEKIAQQAQPQDTLVVFLAGHGVTLGQRYYFITHEFKPESEQTETDVRNQGLPQDVLGDMLAQVPALKRVLIFDTCQSGGALPSSRTGRDPFAFRGALERLSRAQGVYTIAAAAAGDEAQEVAQLKHGVLTYALLAGVGAVEAGPLAGQTVKPAGDARLVDIRDWFAFAQDKVPLLTKLYFGQEQFVEYRAGQSNFPLLPLPGSPLSETRRQGESAIR